MQRLITLDGVIYVHQNPKRRRRRPVYQEPEIVEAYAEPEPEPEPYLDPEPEPELEAHVAAEPELHLAAEAEAETAETGSYAEPSAEWSPEPEPEPAAAEPAVTAEAPETWPRAEPVTVAKSGPPNTRTIVRKTPAPPPPGYAIEFGTGRLVKIHSWKGRMSYPSSGW